MKHQIQHMLLLAYLLLTASNTYSGFWLMDSSFPRINATNMVYKDGLISPTVHNKDGTLANVMVVCHPETISAEIMPVYPQYDALNHEEYGGLRGANPAGSLSFVPPIEYETSFIYPRVLAFKVGERVITGNKRKIIDDYQVINSFYSDCQIDGFCNSNDCIYEVLAYRWDPSKKNEMRGTTLPATFAEYNERLNPKSMAAYWVNPSAKKVWLISGFEEIRKNDNPRPLSSRGDTCGVIFPGDNSEKEIISYSLVSIRDFSKLLQSSDCDPNEKMTQFMEEVWYGDFDRLIALGEQNNMQAARKLIESLKKDFGEMTYAHKQSDLIPAIQIMKHYYGESICPLIIHTALTTDDTDLRSRCAVAFRAIASPKIMSYCIKAFDLFPKNLDDDCKKGVTH